MIKVIVNGANGKMGQAAVAAIEQANDLKLVASADKNDDLAALIQQHQAQVVVDLTTAGAGFNNAAIILNANARPVIGTSGISNDEVAKLQQLAAKRQLSGLIVPNFAIGAVLMMQLAAQAAKHFSQVDIIEMHHDAKAEAPSGTAIRTAEIINHSADMQPPKVAGKEIIKGALGASVKNVKIHSVRLPGLVAHQQVTFGGIDETFTLRHDSLSRQSFMPGLVLACRKVMDLQELKVGLEHVL